MAYVSIYLNFQGNAEEAFSCYKKVFKTEFSAPIMRMGDLPPNPSMPAFSDQDKNKVMHVALPILGGTQIMATDMLESMAQNVKVGNNTTISLNIDSKAEADRLYLDLSQGGDPAQCVAPHDEFWGYWGVCLDRFGIRWMFNVSSQSQNK